MGCCSVERVADQARFFEGNVIPDALTGAVQVTMECDESVIAEVFNARVTQRGLVNDDLHAKVSVSLGQAADHADVAFTSDCIEMRRAIAGYCVERRLSIRRCVYALDQLA